MNKYNIGDIVYIIGYSLGGENFCTRKLTIYKMEIVEIIKNDNEIIYKTDIETGLERHEGGFLDSDFINFRDIIKQVNKFIKEDNNE